MTRILCIQFRENPVTIDAEQKSILREAGEARFDFISALDESVLWREPEEILSGYDAVILGGSGDFDFDGGRSVDDPARVMSQILLTRLTPLFDYIFAHLVPTLGICYGHQIIGAYRGAKVVHDTAQHKIGTHTVRLTSNASAHPLFAEVPESLTAQYGHKDALDRLPEGATLLASGERCNASALCYKNAIYTTQFHPEMTEEDVHARLGASERYLPPGMALKDIVAPSPFATEILRNFFRWVASQK